MSNATEQSNKISTEKCPPESGQSAGHHREILFLGVLEVKTRYQWVE